MLAPEGASGGPIDHISSGVGYGPARFVCCNARSIRTPPFPATATALFSFTVYVEEITLTNKTDSNVTCSILDRQSTPRELFTGVVNAGSVYVMPFKGRKMPGGITWSCTNGTAVIGYVYGRRG
jgi:hypothetical protein